MKTHRQSFSMLVIAMTFSSQWQSAACQNKTKVVPGVKQDWHDETSCTELPYPAKKQRGHKGQQHQGVSLMQCVQHRKNDCSVHICQAQTTHFGSEFYCEPAVQAVAEYGFFSDGRNKQQGEQASRRTSSFSQVQPSLHHQPSANRSAPNGQCISGKFGCIRLKNRLIHGFRIIAAALLLVPAVTAFAGLGEHESSVEKDRMRMHARRSVAAMPLYSINDLLTSDGSRVRQYVSFDGVVFAVSWNTLYKPDLSEILGTTYPIYAAAAQEAALRPGIQRRFRHENLDVVVQSTAHLNVFSGFAFRRSILPKGVSPERLGLE